MEPRRQKTRGEPDQLVVNDGWREDAACRRPINGMVAEDWFSANRSSLAGRATIERIKAVCADCPVRQACLSYAMDTEQPWGIWGGKTAIERGTEY